MKSKILTTGILLITLLINSCIKEDCNCDVSLTGGKINVNISGESCDGVPLEESYIADKYSSLSEYQNACVYLYEGQRHFEIVRYAENIESKKNISLFLTEKDNVLTSIYININYYRLLDDNSTLILQLGTDQNDSEITDFTYDASTGIVKGSYTCNLYCLVENNYIKKMTVSGDFNVKVIELIR